MKIGSVSGLGSPFPTVKDPCPLAPSNGFLHHTILSQNNAQRTWPHHDFGIHNGVKIALFVE